MKLTSAAPDHRRSGNRRDSELLRGAAFSRLAALTVAGAVMAGTLNPWRANAAAERYVIDPNHMAIAFLVSHVGFAETLGQFTKAEGSFLFDDQKPSVSDIEVRIDAASVDTQHAARDEHLRKEDFLWVEKFPEITFRGTGSQQTGSRTGKIIGDLTIRGVTRPVTLDVTWNKSGYYPFGDKHWAAGFSARTTIKRSDFGMTYALEGGLVGDEVDIILEFEAIRRPA
jgi:polyisoprenoid-binding protein YceI